MNVIISNTAKTISSQEIHHTHMCEMFTGESQSARHLVQHTKTSESPDAHFAGNRWYHSLNSVLQFVDITNFPAIYNAPSPYPVTRNDSPCVLESTSFSVPGLHFGTVHSLQSFLWAYLIIWIFINSYEYNEGIICHCRSDWTITR
jgi:hypothetical protein